MVGQSQLFTATSFGGTQPYTYQWYLNDAAIPGAIESTYTFTPESADTYQIYVIVTDDVSDTAQSNTAPVTVSSPTAAFDFGTSGSPVEAGYVQVTESTLYSAGLGYGWSATSGLDSRDRGAPDSLRRDFVFSSTEHTFNVDLENGDYQITIVIGDQDFMHDMIDVYAEDNLEINDLTAPAGSFQQETFWVTVTDGQLNIRIQDNGGADANWVINTLTVEPSFL